MKLLASSGSERLKFEIFPFSASQIGREHMDRVLA
jgi:hypothetical protein